MPLFKRYLTEADLPLENFEREGLSLDVKGKHPGKYKPVDLAEQIAAFANTLGGCILIGANEQAGGTYVYDVMEEDMADAARVRYEHAGRDFCSPNPILESVVIQRVPGFVTAINVWPFPGQAIGVRHGPPDKPAWLFPFRVGTQTKFLSAEQLPMIMLPELRKPAILLSQIVAGESVQIQNQGGGQVVNAAFHEIQLQTGTFTIQIPPHPASRPMGGGAMQIATIPLEAVYLVWKHHSDGWQIAVRGQVHTEGTFQPATQLRTF